MKSIKVKIGDVFAIPLGNGEYAYGQIVDDSKYPCYIIYDLKSTVFPAIQEIVTRRIIILTYTVDVFIKSGRWPLLGNIAPPSDIVFPYYLVGTLEDGNEKIIVMDHRGIFLRYATESDQQRLTRMSSFSPKALEDIAKFKFLGIGKYLSYMDKLIYRGIK